MSEQDSVPEGLAWLAARLDLILRFDEWFQREDPEGYRKWEPYASNTRKLYASLAEEVNRALASVRKPDTRVPVNITAQIILLAFMWLIVLTIPVAIQDSKLSAETQQTLDDYYGLIAGLVVSVSFLVAPKLMKKNQKK